MEFRTEVDVPKYSIKLNHQSKILMMGSCFTNNIGSILKDFKFDVNVNPYGISYNPISIFEILNRCVENNLWKEEDLIESEGIWKCFDVHSDYSDSNKSRLLKTMNEDLQKLWSFLSNADSIIISLGTSWVYEHIDRKKLVNNCHKIPNKEFNKRLLYPKEIFKEFSRLHNKIKEINPKIEWLFTISPIRHKRDGLIESNNSKSILNVLVRWICEDLDHCSYFPSYEIMMDDLRDYRFYKSDMLHPNDVAIEYIWNKFSKSIIDEKSQQINEELDSINKALSHKPFNPESKAHLKFLSKIEERKLVLEKQYSCIRF